MPIIHVEDTDCCGNVLELQSPGGLSLPDRKCILPKDHAGNHSDGVGVWLNLHRIKANLDKGLPRDA